MVAVFRREKSHHDNSASSRAVTGVTKKFAGFAFILKYRRQFVPALEDEDLLWTAVLDNGTRMIISPQASMQIH
jgi:hypothetical protein